MTCSFGGAREGIGVCPPARPGQETVRVWCGQVCVRSVCVCVCVCAENCSAGIVVYHIADYFLGKKVSRIFAVTRKYYSRKEVGIIL